jgi:hypothetical protein
MAENLLHETHTFSGQCARCKRTITGTLEFDAEGGKGPMSGQPVVPPPVIGSYCECGDEKLPGGLNGAQAVPLTLRGVPE